MLVTVAQNEQRDPQTTCHGHVADVARKEIVEEEDDGCDLGEEEVWDC